MKTTTSGTPKSHISPLQKTSLLAHSLWATHFPSASLLHSAGKTNVKLHTLLPVQCGKQLSVCKQKVLLKLDIAQERILCFFLFPLYCTCSCNHFFGHYAMWISFRTCTWSCKVKVLLRHSCAYKCPSWNIYLD